MNFNTRFLIFGYLLSLYGLKVHAANDVVPGSIRGVIPKPKVDLPDAIPKVSTEWNWGKSMESIDAILAIGKLPSENVVVPPKTFKTVEEALEEVESQTKIVADQINIIKEAQQIIKDGSEKIVDMYKEMEVTVTKVKTANQEAKSASNAAESLVKAEDASKATAEALVKANAFKDSVKQFIEKAKTIIEANKKTSVAAILAKDAAEKAEELDKAADKPQAKKAKEQAEAIAKLAVQTEKASVAIIELIGKGRDSMKKVENLMTVAEENKKQAEEAAKAKGNTSSSSAGSNTVKPKENTDLPDKPNDALMNYVVDNKYDYQDQLLKEDRCTEDDIEKAKCKDFSNCYRDNKKPVCICFPGYSSDDASKNDCKKVDKPTCSNKANTCHMNANCKADDDLGIGCQCKEKFNGDGLLCSSALSYFINFFLILSIVSVQLYM